MDRAVGALVVGAAADGGDLLVVEAALATPGVALHVILPTPDRLSQNPVWEVVCAWMGRRAVLALWALIERLGGCRSLSSWRAARCATDGAR